MELVHKQNRRKQRLIVDYFKEHPFASIVQMCSHPAIDISPRTYYNWLKTYPDFHEEMTMKRFEEDDAVCEKAESLLKKAIEMDDTDAAKFWLKHKGKHRGWGVANTNDNQSNKPPVINFVLVQTPTPTQPENTIDITPENPPNSDGA